MLTLTPMTRTDRETFARKLMEYALALDPKNASNISNRMQESDSSYIDSIELNFPTGISVILSVVQFRTRRESV